MRYGLIIPSMMIITDRVALHTRDDAIRITFDLEPQWRTSDLTFEQSFEGTPLLPEGETIMEIKCLDAYPLWLVHALNVSRLYPTACSKYERAFYSISKDRRRPNMALCERRVTIANGYRILERS
jgi:hypothetical protein